MAEQTSDMPGPDVRPWLDLSRSFLERARLLVSEMTLEEKAWQMVNHAPGIPRLGVPPYNWWNECLHGVGRAGVATVFPQAIGLAAMWNDDLLQRIAQVISDEARAKHHEALRRGELGIYKGLTFWSPNINIFRDPRWGRGQETYGEDPYLTGRLGVAFVRGLQGDDENYLKLVATPKHYAVHSGPEQDRHHFNAVVSPKDLRETYLPAFRDCVVEGKAVSVMGAYNRTNDEPCCASKALLEDILRDEWGFEGYVVSDCGAICDIHTHHRVTSSPAESAALAVKNGCDLNCGEMYKSLTDAVEQGLIIEDEIDTALVRLFEARFRLGMFDPPERVPFASIPYEVNDCTEHRGIAREAARQSIVLLKNNGVLPLRRDAKTLAVIGPNADSLDVLLGNYNGTPSKWVTLLAGIRAAAEPDTRVFYAKGCEVSGGSEEGFWEAEAAAERAEIVIMCLGLSPRLEGEEGDAAESDGGGDRVHIGLPAIQERLLQRVGALGRPMVVVLTNGSPVAAVDAHATADAVLSVWYPGEEGGAALSDVLFGEFSPAGRLPVTFVSSLDDVPPFDDYRMSGRTYRYFEGEPLYPFGFGLSYTRFEYDDIDIIPGTIQAGGEAEVTVTVRNSGERAGDEVVQFYVSHPDSAFPVPLRQLAGFQRISLRPGERRQVTFNLDARRLSVIDENGRRLVSPGRVHVVVGGSQGDSRSIALGAAPSVETDLVITGSVAELPF